VLQAGIRFVRRDHPSFNVRAVALEVVSIRPVDVWGKDASLATILRALHSGVGQLSKQHLPVTRQHHLRMPNKVLRLQTFRR